MSSLVVILYILPIPIMKWFDIIDQCAKLSPFIIYSAEIIILGMLGFCGYAIFLMVHYKIKKAKKKKRKKNKRSRCVCDEKFRRA